MENIDKVVIKINNITEVNIITSFLDCIGISDSAGNDASEIINHIVISPLYGIINDNTISWVFTLSEEQHNYDIYNVIPFIEKYNKDKIRCAYISLLMARTLRDKGFNIVAKSAYSKIRLNSKQYPNNIDTFIKYNPNHHYLKEAAEVGDIICLFKLLLLIRDCYRNGWVPDFTNDTKIKFGIKTTRDKIRKIPIRNSNNVFSFETREDRDLFYDCFLNELYKIKEFL